MEDLNHSEQVVYWMAGLSTVSPVMVYHAVCSVARGLHGDWASTTGSKFEREERNSCERSAGEKQFC